MSVFDTRDYEAVKQLTAERMADPQPGDRFHEMYSFWVQVVARIGRTVVFQEVSGASNGDLQALPVEKFAERWAYKCIPGYSVLYHDNNLGRVMEFVE